MKKFLKIFVLLLLVVPFAVKADMGAPEIKSYDVVVTNPDGVDYYLDRAKTQTAHLEKDEVVTVDFEMVGSESSEFDIKKSDGTKGYLDSLDGLIAVKEEINPEEYLEQGISKLESPKKAIVYAEGGVDIQAGPATGYKVLGHLKKGTELEYQYISGREDNDTTYIYVETKEATGWINILNSNVLIGSTYEYIFKSDVETTCGTIPMNTVLKPKYRTDTWSHKALFKYNDCEVLLGVFRDKNILPIYGSKNISYIDVDIHKTADLQSEVIGTIPANAEYIGIANYSEYEGAEDLLSYVEYNGVKGWVYYESRNDFKYIEEYQLESQVTEEPTKEEPKNEDPKKEEPTKDDPKKSSSFFSGENFVIICVVAGVALALAAVVTIVLVNKKKKNKDSAPLGQPTINPSISNLADRQTNEDQNNETNNQ